MSEILQSVHSLAVTNEVIKQRRREGSQKCFSPLPSPRELLCSPLSLIKITRSRWKHTVWSLLPHNTPEGVALTTVKDHSLLMSQNV